MSKFQSFCSKVGRTICSFNPRQDITVEPILFLYMFAYSLTGTIRSGLVYQKVCLNLYDDTICNDLLNETYKDEELAVQGETSRWDFYDAIAGTAPAMFTTLIFGSWSDKVSRKMPMIIPPVGAIFSNVVYLLNGIYLPGPLPFLLLGPFMGGLSGGWITVLMAVFSYLSMITTEKNRTVRSSIVEAMTSLGSVIGSAVSGQLLKVTSFPFIFLISICINALMIIYVIFILKNVKSTDSTSQETSKIRNYKSTENALDVTESSTSGIQLHGMVDFKSDTIERDVGDDMKSTKTCSQICSKMCNVTILKDGFVACFKKRENNGRLHVLIELAIVFCITLGGGALVVSYLYLRHPPLAWSQSMFGYYRATQSTIRAVGFIIVIPITKKLLHMQDITLVILGLLTTTIHEFLFGFSNQTWMVFALTVVDIFGSGIFPCLRSLLAEEVEADEIGKIYAAMSCVENGTFSLASALFNFFLYPATVAVFPGLCFVIGATIKSISFVLALILLRSLRKYRKYGTLKEEINAHDDGLQLDSKKEIEEPKMND